METQITLTRGQVSHLLAILDADVTFWLDEVKKAEGDGFEWGRYVVRRLLEAGDLRDKVREQAYQVA
jgi:hypothetical protein